MNNSRILVFADTASEMENLRPAFADLPAHWQVTFCKSQREAMTTLEGKECQVVFADTAAGAGAGAQFLHEVWKLHPKTVRYLIGDSVEVDVMLTCVLGAHQFMERPVKPDAVQALLPRVEVINGLISNKKIQTLVSKMRTFPSRPSLYLEVLKEFRSPSASPKVIGDLVSKDMAISTKLIQIVNSAYYGLAQHITDPADAVMLIGMEATSSLILSIDAFARFDKLKPLYFSIDKVWRHSQAVAHAAKRFALSMTGDTALANDAFTAGLLHDIGKLAIALNFEQEYQNAMVLAEKNSIPPVKVEKELFGASHADVGAYLISLWGLPLSIVEAVASHHLPPSEVLGKFSPATAVHLANACTDVDQPVVQSLPAVTKSYPAELGLEQAVPKLSKAFGVDEPPAENSSFFVKARPEGPDDSAVAGIVEVNFVPPQQAKSSRGPLLCLAAAACVVLGGFTLFLMSGSKADREPGQKVQASEEITTPEPPVALAAVSPAPAPSAPQAAQTPSVQEDNLAGVKLQGIMYKGANSTAFINGASFRIGDEVAGAKIVAVTPRDVTFQKGSRQLKLALK